MKISYKNQFIKLILIKLHQLYLYFFALFYINNKIFSSFSLKLSTGPITGVYLFFTFKFYRKINSYSIAFRKNLKLCLMVFFEEFVLRSQFYQICLTSLDEYHLILNNFSFIQVSPTSCSFFAFFQLIPSFNLEISCLQINSEGDFQGINQNILHFTLESLAFSFHLSRKPTFMLLSKGSSFFEIFKFKAFANILFIPFFHNRQILDLQLLLFAGTGSQYLKIIIMKISQQQIFYTFVLSQQTQMEMQKIITIIFIWLGSQDLPDQYVNTLRNCSEASGFSCILLTEPHWKIYSQKYQKELNMSLINLNLRSGVVRSDILRYLYLYSHGGVYSDLDNVIDYKCLKTMLSEVKTLKFSEEQRSVQDYHTLNNNFIYAPENGSKILLEIITHLWQRSNLPVLQFTGPVYLRTKNYPFMQVHECVTHLYFGSWNLNVLDLIRQQPYIAAGIFSNIILMILIVKHTFFMTKKSLIKAQLESTDFQKPIL